MEISSELPQKWKNVESIDEAKRMVDYGAILHWREARRLIKAFNQEDQDEMVRHFATRFAENHEARLALELLIESFLAWLANTNGDERTLQVFLETLLVQADRSEACMKLVEVALTVELADQEHDEDMFASAVSLICELGLALFDLERQYPGEIKRVQAIKDHVATYLLSVSNTNDSRIRLSLLNYFGASEHGLEFKQGFNKVLGRFGHTVLDHLFYLLFKKKTEAVALQYLIENLPYILEADHHAQRIVHETWKFYMLKKPERFGLFLKTFSEHFNSMGIADTRLSRRIYFQHLGALLRVVSEVNHKQLVQVILSCFAKFQGMDRDEVLDEIQKMDLRKGIKELVAEVKTSVDATKVIESAARFTSAKRGRKPSFARVQGWQTVNQVQYLGSQPTAVKVS